MELLPALKGWSISSIEYEGELGSETKNNPMILYSSDSDERGWLLGAVFKTDVDDAELQITYDPTAGGQTLVYSLNPKTLHDRYLIERNVVSPYVQLYDDAVPVYVAGWNPYEPVPFYGRVTVQLIGGSADANVYARADMILINNYSAFLESIEKILHKQPQLRLPRPEEFVPAERKYRGFLP